MSFTRDTEPKRLSPFRVIIITVVFMIMGAALIPRLNIRLKPQTRSDQISVSFGYNAPAKVVEINATRLIEGALNSLDCVSRVSSVSSDGYGMVNVSFKKGTDIEAARFLVLCALRNISISLPEGVYPYINGQVSGGEETILQTYDLIADMPLIEITDWAQRHLVERIGRIKGVNRAAVTGAMPFEWVVKADPDKLESAGLGVSHLLTALSDCNHSDILGSLLTPDGLVSVRLNSLMGGNLLEDIPLSAGQNGVVYRASDFATAEYRQIEPESYYRANGKNCVQLTVFASDAINTLQVAKQVSSIIGDPFVTPADITIEKIFDVSTELEEEINRIVRRTFLSLAFLLLFVLLVSRNLRYTCIIAIAIFSNLLCAAVLFYLFGVELEIVSMAGLTVSLGMIIDTSIVMADHYSYYGNRSVMGAIAGASLTSVVALLLVFVLPESLGGTLHDFVWVVVIMLSVSMPISALLIPALVNVLGNTNGGMICRSFRRRRFIQKCSDWYARRIRKAVRHKRRSVILVILIIGIPLNLLPNKIGHGCDSGFAAFYNKTIGSGWYQDNRDFFEYLFGGSINLFTRGLQSEARHGTKASEDFNLTLSVYAQMPDGGTATQMNEIMRPIERMLAGYDLISGFRTSINQATAHLDIDFKDDAGSFPMELKRELWRIAQDNGGATWTIAPLYPGDKTLTNGASISLWPYMISIYGYSYDKLHAYATELLDSLRNSPRVELADFTENPLHYDQKNFVMNLDRERMALWNINPYLFNSSIMSHSFRESLGTLRLNGTDASVRVVSSVNQAGFDRWQLENGMLSYDSIQVFFPAVGKIERGEVSTRIDRDNQEYVIMMGFDYSGSEKMAISLLKKLHKTFNQRLPVGFRVGERTSGGYSAAGGSVVLAILLAILAIFIICAVMFDSARMARSIFMLLLFGIIGILLVFPITKTEFGSGGLAAIIMSCGLTVNAGIYLSGEYMNLQRSHQGKADTTRLFVKAFNRKIIPILLTVASTIVGLLPFLFTADSEGFWFQFAVGVSGGLLFSLIGLVWFFPLLLYRRKQ